jgi:hypothetical protein
LIGVDRRVVVFTELMEFLNEGLEVLVAESLELVEVFYDSPR